MIKTKEITVEFGKKEKGSQTLFLSGDHVEGVLDVCFLRVHILGDLNWASNTAELGKRPSRVCTS